MDSILFGGIEARADIQPNSLVRVPAGGMMRTWYGTLGMTPGDDLGIGTGRSSEGDFQLEYAPLPLMSRSMQLPTTPSQTLLSFGVQPSRTEQ